ncbi:MAG: ankyrin repeat domain-containing protein [Azospirillaceae bacterium]|nr:ankyrin repeat domain-containing protein [Azospirillaceae bacterium]
MRRLWVLVVLLLPLSVAAAGRAAADATGPSFDCAKAVGPIEKRICADPDLAAHDRKLAETYQHLLDISGPRHDRFVASQRSWLHQRAVICLGSGADTPAVCLTRQYEERTAELDQWAREIRDERQAIYIDRQIIATTFPLMGDAPMDAERILRTYDTAQGRIGLAMVLRLASANPGAHDAEVRKLLHDSAEEIAQDETFSYLRAAAENYKGDVAGLVPFATLIGSNIELSCKLLKRYPDLMESIDTQLYSAEQRYSPFASCDEPGFPDSVRQFRKMVMAFDGGYFDHCAGMGYMGRIFARATNTNALEIQLTPQYLLKKIQARPEEQQEKWLLAQVAVPLESWSYLSVWNRMQFQRVRGQFLAALQDLAAYYQHAFGLSQKDAHLAAYVNLMSDYRWTINGGAPAINVAIMDADAKPSLAEMLAAGEPAEVKGEPLLSLAVVRPSAIATLLAAHTPVDGVSPIGKTPLMTAAQFNSLDAIQQLLKAGAAINRQTLAPGEIEDNSAIPDSGAIEGCATYNITHGQRTALMYAAANAGLPIIQALLAAGADTHLKDSQGATALDYLEGRGPVPANPILVSADLETARRLLAK